MCEHGLFGVAGCCIADVMGCMLTLCADSVINSRQSGLRSVDTLDVSHVFGVSIVHLHR